MNQYQTALSELSELFDRVDDAAVDTLVSYLMKAKKIVVFGAGRERLQVMGLAMRLFHLGLAASVVGDMDTPAVGKGDVFFDHMRTGLIVHCDCVGKSGTRGRCHSSYGHGAARWHQHSGCGFRNDNSRANDGRRSCDKFSVTHGVPF